MRGIFGWLFAAALAGAIVLGTLSEFVPADAQGTGAQTPEEVIAEIERWAKLHQASLDKPDPDFAKENFPGNPAGFSTLRIQEIYTEAFQLQRQLNRPPLWKRWLPNEGSLVAFVLAVMLALQNSAIKAWVVKPFEKASEWLYQQLAGNPLFRERALRRYRTALLEHYEELKIPFRQGRPLRMEEVYVPLKASAATGDRALEIDAYQAVTENARLMVKGAPGSGKTMLVRYLALTYAWEKLLLPKRPVPVLLELYRVSDEELTEEKLIAALVEAFDRYDFPKAERFVRDYLKRGRLLLLLDGLDEVSLDARQRVVQCIRDLLRKYSDCRVVCTCRTMVYNNEFAQIADSTLEVAEFSDRQIRLFLNAWSGEMPAGKSVESLLRDLRDRPRIMALARNPLLLTMIAYLYTDTDFKFPYLRSEFYQRSTLLLLDEWQQDRNKYKAVEKQRVLQHLALFNQDAQQLRQSGQEERKAIAYETLLTQIKVVLPKLDRSPEADTVPILNEIVERSGLLIKVDRSGSSYQFAHLTLQEYFAAEALASDEAGLLQRFESDRGAWRETVKLWCGIAHDSTHVVVRAYE